MNYEFHPDADLGAPVHGEIRHFVLRRFPFSVVYFVGDKVIYVLALAHGSRVPGYWRSRRRS